MWEKKRRTTPQETSGLLMGEEQVTRTKTLQAIWWRRWWCALDIVRETVGKFEHFSREMEPYVKYIEPWTRPLWICCWEIWVSL